MEANSLACVVPEHRFEQEKPFLEIMGFSLYFDDVLLLFLLLFLYQEGVDDMYLFLILFLLLLS